MEQMILIGIAMAVVAIIAIVYLVYSGMIDLEFNMQAAVIAIIFWFIILIMIWKVSILGEMKMMYKIILTIGSLPAAYIGVAAQLNR